MTAVTNNDAWMEKALITISLQGGSDVEFWGLTESIDFDGGEKDINGVALVNGGRVIKWDPQSDMEVTLEAYPLFAGTSSGTAGKGFFDLMNSPDASDPIAINNDFTRQLFRIAVMWTNDPSVVSAKNTIASTYSGMRITLAACVFTSIKPSFTDGILKFTVKAKCVPFDKAASNNFRFESDEGAAQVPALSAYTTANKF